MIDERYKHNLNTGMLVVSTKLNIFYSGQSEENAVSLPQPLAELSKYKACTAMTMVCIHKWLTSMHAIQCEHDQNITLYM